MTLEGDRPESERYQEAKSLAGLTEPGVFAAARRVFIDPEWRVRRAGWEALLQARISHDARLAFLLENLEDPEYASARGTALEALIHLGPTIIPGLMAALPHRAARGRRFILDVLTQVKAPEGLPAAREYVADADENVAFAAAEVIGVSGSAHDVDFLLSALTSSHDSRRFAILSALVTIAGRMPVSIPVAPLGALLDDALLRGTAAELMGLTAPLEAAQVLWNHIINLKTADLFVPALDGLVRRHGRLNLRADAVKLGYILERCQSPGASPAMRRGSFDLLMQIQPASLGLLAAVLAEHDADWLHERIVSFTEAMLREVMPALVVTPKGKAAAARVLRERPELDGEPQLLSLLTQPGDHRVTVLSALAEVGAKRSVPHLVAMCGDDDELLASGASEALVRLAQRGVRGSETVIYNAMDAASPETAMMLLPAIGMLAEGRACSLLALAMRDSHAEVRLAAVRAAAHAAADADVAAGLLLRLADEDDDVRAAAAESIGDAGLRDAIDRLRVLLDDSNDWVCSAALGALSRLGDAPDTGQMIELLRRGGVSAVAAARALGQSARAHDVLKLAEVVPELEAEAAAELLRSLAAYEADLPQSALEKLRGHGSWQVRAALVLYVGAKLKPWMRAFVEAWILSESDEWVQNRLREIIGA